MESDVGLLYITLAHTFYRWTTVVLFVFSYASSFKFILSTPPPAVFYGTRSNLKTQNTIEHTAHHSAQGMVSNP